jgi:transposase
MDKDTKYVGIDISKDTFDVCLTDGTHKVFSNTSQGFRLFKKSLSKMHHCAMEATGSYHHQLATFLFEQEIAVSVINPVVIRRFIQMKLVHNKTDKSDAHMIALYAHQQPLTCWKPEAQFIIECKAINSAVAMYHKQCTALKNKVHALTSSGCTNLVLLRSLKRQIKHLTVEISTLDATMLELVRANCGQLLTCLLSIPGIGAKTGISLILTTGCFEQFSTPKQVSAFIGLAPMERTSGSSVRGQSRITKRGNPHTRYHLFLCSFTACKYNPQCKALYERIIAKGKSKKLALIAVSNKLLKQAYGVVKSGIPYDPMFKRQIA